MPSSSASDPISAAVSALAVDFAKPTGNGADPASYKSGSATVPNPGLVSLLTNLLGVLYGASTGLKNTGSFVADAFKNITNILRILGDQVALLPDVVDIPGVLDKFQTALSAANAMPAPDPSGPPGAASSLYSQLEALLSNVKSAADAAILFYSLAQQLEALASDIAPKP
jgi:hypothetical protein